MQLRRAARGGRRRGAHAARSFFLPPVASTVSLTRSRSRRRLAAPPASLACLLFSKHDACAPRPVWD